MAILGTYRYLIDRKFRLVIPYELRTDGDVAVCLLPGNRLLVARAQDLESVTTECRKAFRGGSRPLAEFRDRVWVLAIAAATGRVLLPRIPRDWLGVEPGSAVAVSGIGIGVAICEYQRWWTEVNRE